MADKRPPERAGKAAADDRDARLAAALRENLRRRKSQSREREPAPGMAETAHKPPAKG